MMNFHARTKATWQPDEFGVVKGPMPGNEIQYKDAGKTDWFRKSDYAFLDPTLKEWYSYSLWDTPVWSYL